MMKGLLAFGSIMELRHFPRDDCARFNSRSAAVGVKVGMHLQNSAHVQRAMTSQETTDRLLGIGANFGAGADVATHLPLSLVLRANKSLSRPQQRVPDSGTTFPQQWTPHPLHPGSA
jgi:hypothetical protein